MTKDWLADVRKYDPDAGKYEGVVTAIVRYCGIALRTENASKVTFADAAETGRVRDNFLKKKLGLTDDDATLDGAIAKVGEAMGSPEQANRVTLYYLLTKHFGKLDLFRAWPDEAAGRRAELDAMNAIRSEKLHNFAAIPGGGTHPQFRPSGPVRPGSGAAAAAAPMPKPGTDNGDFIGIAAVAGAVAIGAMVFAALASAWTTSNILTSDEVAPPPPPAAAPMEEPEAAPPPEPEVPEGAGVTATERDGLPMLSVYFDSGSADVSPQFGEVSGKVLEYLEANPDAKVQISGFNDPSGNAELNAELSKTRAENVQAALVAAGVAEDRTDLVKPDDATTTDVNAAEARRVEITIVK